MLRYLHEAFVKILRLAWTQVSTRAQRRTEDELRMTGRRVSDEHQLRGQQLIGRHSQRAPDGDLADCAAGRGRPSWSSLPLTAQT